MIILTNIKKSGDINPDLFKIISINNESIKDKNVAISHLSIDVTNEIIAADMSKKKNLKVLEEVMSNYENETVVFNIGKFIERKVKGLAIVYNDDNKAVSKLFANYIASVYGINLSDKKEVEDFTTDIKKIIKSNKKEKEKKVAKLVSSEIENTLRDTMTMNIEGIDFYRGLQKKYAMDTVLAALKSSEIIIIDNRSKSITINEDFDFKENFSKDNKKTVLKSISTTLSNKEFKKAVKKVIDLKAVEKPKKDKDLIIAFLTIYEIITNIRSVNSVRASDIEFDVKKDKKVKSNKSDKKKDKSKDDSKKKKKKSKDSGKSDKKKDKSKDDSKKKKKKDDDKITKKGSVLRINSSFTM